MAKTELQKAIDKLVAREPGWKEFLKPAPAASSIGPSIGVGKPKGGQSAAGGGGGDLTERSFAERTYYADKFVKSSDGLFSFQALKSLTFVDGTGAVVKMTFQPPPQ